MSVIELLYCKGDVLIFNVDHWLQLRQKYRIVGEVIGNTNFVPTLPVKLYPEEVLLLIEKKIANVYSIDSINTSSTTNKEEFTVFENILLEHEQIEYKRLRKLQLEGMLDKIVTKRRENGDNRSSEEILEEELNKSTLITKTTMIWPTFLTPPLTTKSSNNTEVTFDDIMKHTTPLRYKVFKDLWEKNYFVTSGEKFGGDYLAYLGDPVVYHAVFIIRCIKMEQKLMPHEIVAFGRLGNSVKKKAILASEDSEGQLSYVTISWADT